MATIGRKFRLKTKAPSHQLGKNSRNSSTGAKKTKVHWLFPPATGWDGALITKYGAGVQGHLAAGGMKVNI